MGYETKIHEFRFPTNFIILFYTLFVFGFPFWRIFNMVYEFRTVPELKNLIEFQREKRFLPKVLTRPRDPETNPVHRTRPTRSHLQFLWFGTLGHSTGHNIIVNSLF